MLKSIFKNLKTTYIFIITMIITAFLLFFIFELRTRNSQKQFINLNLKISDYQENIKKLENSLKTYKINEHPEDLYIYKKDSYTEKVRFYINALIKINNDISANSEKYFDINIKLNENKDIINDIENKFNILNDNYIKIGNSDNGYLKQIKTSEEKIIKITEIYPALNSNFKKLIKAKEILLKAGTPESENDFIQQKDEFLRYIRKNNNIFSGISEKQIIKNNISEWINSVLNCYKLIKVNGNNFYNGLYDKIFEDITISENIFNEIQKFYITEQDKKNKAQFITLIFLILIFIGFFILAAFLLYKNLKKQTENIIKKLNKTGINITEKEENELKLINKLIQHLEEENDKKVALIKQIINNNADDTISLSEKDYVSKALINLKEALSEKEERENKINILKSYEDRNKDGMIKFGKIIRKHFGNIDDLSFNFLTELVHFLNADIGGIYIINDKNKPEYLKLTASYAYDQKKIINKEIKLGEGLVGTCAIDKSSVFIDNIDNDYIKIVSGFGHTKPNNILLTPILANNQVLGVIELASSGNFSEYDIKFLEQLAEDLGYTLVYLLN